MMEDSFDEWIEICPVCGEYIDYCGGHGIIGDPFGAAIIEDHYENDKHDNCHENADCQKEEN